MFIQDKYVVRTGIWNVERKDSRASILQNHH
jgi:hypothetical protein